MRTLLILAQGAVELDPDPSKFPGGGVLQSLTNGVAGLALIICLLGLVVGASMWALGSNSNNFQQTVNGKRAVVVSGVAALLIGAAPALINFFFGAGTGVQ
jgi:hypothetical protein